jgi:cytochrome o ubiquinol oxidase subunit II
MLSIAMRKAIASSKRLQAGLRYGGRILAFVAAAALGGCSEGVLDPKGPVASAEKLILFDSLGIMLAIVVPTIVATLGVAFWFRASNTRAFYWPEWKYSGRLELIVWSIPAMTVMLLGSLCWVGSHELDPGKPLASAVKPLTIQVVSLDWKWLFIYPEQGIASVNALTIPVATPINLELTSSGVMNSFFVPQLGSQIYTMGQMMTRLVLFRPRGAAGSIHGVGGADKRRGASARPAELCRTGKAEPGRTAVRLPIHQPGAVHDARKRGNAADRAFPQPSARLTRGA